MMPWVRSALVVAAVLAAGAFVARALPFDGAGRGRASRGLEGAWLLVGVAFAAILHPAAAIVLVVVVAALAAGGGPVLKLLGDVAAPACSIAPAPPSGAEARNRRRAAIACAVAVLAVVVVTARPSVPLYWDEYVWLGKARLAAGGAAALRDASLDPHGTIVPPGYPLLWPLLVGWLALGHVDTASLVVASRLVGGVACASFVAELAVTFRSRAVAIAAPVVALVAAPMLFVHLRTSYVDLPLGLLSGALALRLARGGASPNDDALATAAYAVALVGMKDEGFLHVAALAGVSLLVARRHGSARRAFAPFAALSAAVVPFFAWRVLLHESHVADADHALALSDLHAALPLARVWLAHLLDLPSWGLFWPIVLGALLAELTRRRAHDALAAHLGMMLVADVALLYAGVVACPERVHEFAMGGTLVGRLLVQHAPLAVAFTARVVESRVAAAAGEPAPAR